MSSSTQTILTTLYDGYALSNADGYSFTSDPIPIRFTSKIGMTAYFTGTPSGTLKMQQTSEAPDDSVSRMAPGKNGSGGVAWTDITGSSQTISAAGSQYFEKANVCSGFIRVVYTATSGTSTVSVWVTGKE